MSDEIKLVVIVASFTIALILVWVLLRQDFYYH